MKTYIIYIIFTFLLTVTLGHDIMAEQTKKTRARIDIQYFNTSINERYLTIKVTTKVNRRYQPVPGAEINIYLDTMVDSSNLGSITTNNNGVAIFTLPLKFFEALDSLSEFTFICALKNHSQVKNNVADLFIKDIELITEYIDQDSFKWIRAIVFSKYKSEHDIPLEQVKIDFFVTRPFNMLPISEPIMTDEEGKATVPFPLDLPGDATGHVTAVVKIDDSDEYGTLEKRDTIQWGIPTVFTDTSLKRSLWAAGANAPIFLLLLTNILIAFIWGTIFYIVYKIYRISKM